MSSQDWLPDGQQESSDGGGSSAPRPYLLVPVLVIGRNERVNAAGWSDPTPGGAVLCKTCNKQMRAQLSELMLFPLVKADTDLLRFTYVLPPHRSGGGFSIDICRGSGTSVKRDVERPTSVKFPAGVQARAGGGVGPSAEPTEDEEETRRSEEELKKKLDGLSPQEAEARYDYLNGKSISELTDDEYEERLALALRLSDKARGTSKKRSD
jgi:hypothetical protein